MLAPIPSLTEPSRLETPVTLAAVSELLVQTGRLLLECGGEISRVEETLVRMGHAVGVPSVHVLCTPTAINFSLIRGEEILTRVLAVRKRGIFLAKVADINEVSRELEDGRLDLPTAAAAIECIAQRPPEYPNALSFLSRGASSACWAMLLGGGLIDFVPAMLCGFIVHLVSSRMAKFMPDFLATFFAALFATAFAVAVPHINHHFHEGAMVVGVIIPLVPGMALTGAVRDLIAGDLVSGVALTAEALLCASAIAAGVASVLSIHRGIL
jgi:uncharacterized membrane protein YjjP (DUF1212 family)